MNYPKIYDALITRARGRVLSVYTESHHVIPRCIGGTNDPDNLVRLTAEEHFVAHQLLVKIYPGVSKIVFAMLAMSRNRGGQRPNNKMFGWMRRAVAIEIGKMKAGIPRPQYVRDKIRAKNTGRIRPPEEIAKASAALKGVPKSAEHAAKVSAALMGRSDIGMYGKKHSEETKAKMSLAAMDRTHTPETIEKLTNFAAAQTQEYRSARAHKAWATKRANAAAKLLEGTADA